MTGNAREMKGKSKVNERVCKEHKRKMKEDERRRKDKTEYGEL